MFSFGALSRALNSGVRERGPKVKELAPLSGLALGLTSTLASLVEWKTMMTS
jgi:hypothetical protein